VLEKASAAPDRVVVIDGVRHITRAEMLDAALCLGNALQKRGIAPGATIAFQLPNWWEACVVNLTAALFGYRLVPLLPIYRTAELNVVLPASGVAAVFVPNSFRGTDFPALIAQLADPPRHVFVVRGNAAAPSAFERLLESAPATPTPGQPMDVRMVLFTSGSTGRPKGVLHSDAAVEGLIRRAAAFWQIGPDDRMYVASPVGHIGGSMYAFEFPWFTDCTAILADTWNPDYAVAAIDRLGATFMAGATPFLTGLIEAAERAHANLPSLRRFVCGGASVPPELVRRGLAQFATAIVGRAYGSTEVPLVCPGVRSRAEAEERADTEGECAVDLRIVDDHDNPVTEGQSGEIVVRGPQMLVGYIDPKDEVGAFTSDGFFRMGDLGRRVAARFLQITGRKKEIIIRKGENISPLEIESALARHPSVRQSAIVGVPDPERGEMVVAFVQPAEGTQFTLEEMIAHLSKLGLARQKFPERLELVREMPTNAVGKVQKTELRARASRIAGAQH
jgi:acyl-CoA synthetase (AMP-forming)/AMP-acid ligase II